MTIDLGTLEHELKKRLSYPETPWGRRQNNAWDKETSFIYQTKTWLEMVNPLRIATSAFIKV